MKYKGLNGQQDGASMCKYRNKTHAWKDDYDSGRNIAVTLLKGTDRKQKYCL